MAFNPLARLLGRTNGSRASAQRLLTIAAIEGNVVVMRDGTRRAVLESSGLSYDLRSFAEQDAIFSGFRQLLNSLDFPLQIIVTVAAADIDGYLAGLHESADVDRLPVLQRLLDEHTAFVRDLAASRELLQRRFLFVIPAESSGQSMARGGLLNFLLGWRAGGETLSPAVAARTLQARCSHVGEALSAMGAHVRRLQGEPLAAAWRNAIGGYVPRHGRRPIDPLDASPVVTGILYEGPRP